MDKEEYLLSPTMYNWIKSLGYKLKDWQITEIRNKNLQLKAIFMQQDGERRHIGYLVYQPSKRVRGQYAYIKTWFSNNRGI